MSQQLINLHESHLRASLFIQFDGHEGRGSLLVDARVFSLPEEVRTARPSDQRLSSLVTFQRTRSCTTSITMARCKRATEAVPLGVFWAQTSAFYATP